MEGGRFPVPVRALGRFWPESLRPLPFHRGARWLKYRVNRKGGAIVVQPPSMEGGHEIRWCGWCFQSGQAMQQGQRQRAPYFRLEGLRALQTLYRPGKSAERALGRACESGVAEANAPGDCRVECTGCHRRLFPFAPLEKPDREKGVPAFTGPPLGSTEISGSKRSPALSNSTFNPSRRSWPAHPTSPCAVSAARVTPRFGS